MIRQKKAYHKIISILMIILACALCWIFLATISQTLIRHLIQTDINFQLWCNTNPILAALTYIFIFSLDAALALPITALMSMLGGKIFGPLTALVYALLGLTIGSTIMFIMIQHKFSSRAQQIIKSKYFSLYDHLLKNKYIYLTLLRMVPIAPFSVVTAAAALCNISLRHFIIITALASIPQLAMYTYTGYWGAFMVYQMLQ